ncbi:MULTISPECIES: cellulase family glycosylhydrolase [unclassified Curtobacterium]|uniref:glycoside hydrolase 5 family protein n=1 Tax=unclassified Curtobacterium TaxID=257496 RepID=UPI0008DEA858|nr:MULTISPECIES: cellulase family glycosylhydrolase [unclassified Curtobacterium]OIH98983.1 glycosyl hydrolase [Curtobacterium sp. MCBA15_003]OII09424.1 glycosyl hydrolase [Curtobacterium sp. MCBA15_009]OII31114.1 glycosyl hydrolase [Curtobacterium sp. MMLR14_006]
MRFGVNYTPSVGWFHSWLDFSPADTARDLEAIASLGADHVRIFPLWPVVQPNRTLIRDSALQDVATVVDIAGSFGLDVNVDALQGHLSSFDFVPSWLDSWHRRNMFTDPDVVASTAAYVRALAAAVADKPNLLGISIGNEVNQFAHAPHPAPHTITAEQGHAWAAAMVAAARSGLSSGSSGTSGPSSGPSSGLEARLGDGTSARPGTGSRPRPLVTVAQYDAAWYDDAQPFGPEHAADHGDATVTHSWVFNGSAALHGALGAGSVRHGEYLLQLAAAWNRDAARPNWLQEVGAPTNVVDPSDAASFTEQTIRHVLDAQQVLGVTWWCSHDVSRSLADFPELEYDLGLFTNDGRLKPAGEAFAALARAGDTGTAAPPSTALVLDDVLPDGAVRHGTRADCAPGGRFAAAWLALAETAADGRGPQVVLRSRLADHALRSARGITTIVEVPDHLDGATLTVAHPATMP